MSNWRIWESLRSTVEEEYCKELNAENENRNINWNFANIAVGRLESLMAADFKALNSCLRVYHENYSQPEGNFWKTFEFLVKSFDTLNMRDATLAANLLRLAYYSMQLEGSSVSEVIQCPLISKGSVCLSYKCETLTEAEFQKLLKVTYNEAHDWRRCHIYGHQVVWDTIMEGKEKVLSSLLRYGVMFLPVPDYSFSVIQHLLYDYWNKRAPRKLISDWGRHYDLPVKRMCMVVRVLKLLAVELETRKALARMREPVPSKKCLDEPAENNSLSSSVFFRCLQRTFETIPEPFVSSYELRKLLREVCGEHMNEETDRRIDRLVSEFEDVYPEGAAIPTPRSLQHLSRCQVRENFRQSGGLPHGVRDLKLPRNIEKYIILE